MKPYVHLLAALFLSTFGAIADTVYVTARTSPSGAGANSDGTYTEVNITLGDTSAIASAPGRPATGGARAWLSGSDLTSTEAGVNLTPTLGNPNSVYQIDHNFSGTADNVSTTVILSANCSDGGTLSFTETDKFQRNYGKPANQWQLLGYITNTSANPTIELRYQSGLVNATSGNRLLVDCWRFTEVVPCLTVTPINVTGPLSTNVAEVVVTGVTNATKITVYQDSGSGMVEIGSKTSGITDGNNTVAVTGLEKDAQVAATQTVGDQEGCVPATGTIVGGGANPTVRVVLNIRENTNLTGPVGAAGSGSVLHFLGSSDKLAPLNALNGAPSEGVILTPSTNWQTVSFTNGVSPLYTWNGTAASPGTWSGQFGGLDGIGFACEGDSGPFDIYIDDLANGTNGVFQDWEGVEPGTSGRGFSLPTTGSGTTSADLLEAPNVAQVVNTTAASGTNSLRVRFQFKDGDTRRWLRLVTANATPVANPQVESTEPISFKILILPKGASLPSPAPGPLSSSLEGNVLTLDWTGTYTLQCATSVTGPYQDVTGPVTGPFTTNTLSAPQLYFRLRSN